MSHHPSEPSPVSTRAILEQTLGELDDHPDGFAYCHCPGAALHTSPTGKRDCRVYYQSGAPTIHCLHSSCTGSVEAANRVLRSALGKLNRGVSSAPVPFVKSSEQVIREREQREAERLAAAARAKLPFILSSFAWPADQIFSDSPERLAGDPSEDWRSILSLFQADDIVWIGDTKESGDVRHAKHFRNAAAWLAAGECPMGPFILPAVLKPGVCSRTKADVERLPFSVFESDKLSKDESGAVFRWLWEEVGLSPLAVVDTGNRSLHLWVVKPDAETLRELRVVLPALGFDGATLRETQPVRLPGCLRPGKNTRQALLYFDQEAAR